MEKCENCGNKYENIFYVVMAGKQHTFDSFECAINKLAPICLNCETRIIGHGVEAPGGTVFCCVSCAEATGIRGLRDHADSVAFGNGRKLKTKEKFNASKQNYEK